MDFADYDRRKYDPLRLAARSFADIQQLRIQMSNRVGRISSDVLATQIDLAQALERQARRDLVAVYKKLTPLKVQEWQDSVAGVGDHTIAMLYGEVGDPTVAVPGWWEGSGENRRLMFGEARLRTPRQLFAYVGVGDPQLRRHRGMTAEEAAAMGRPRAKVILHLLEEAVMKNTKSPYRAVYDNGRERYEEAVHEHDCVRCGPSGKPAKAGTELSKAHKHARSLRLAGKAFLLDWWRVDYGEEPRYKANGHIPRPEVPS